MILGMGLPKTNMLAGGWPSALLLVLAGAAHAEDPRVAQARAVEAEQQQALLGKSFEIASNGVLMDGRKRHQVATWRRISYPAALSWLHGEFDGQPVDEEALREKMAGKKK